MNSVNRLFGFGSVICAVATLFGVPALAADDSQWIEDNYSGIRLISGTNSNDDDALHAGIEIKMKPGWHTYWRYPGDSGVPPRFSFTGSDNLATAKVLYPAPHAFTDEVGTTIGYKGTVILPVQVIPRQKDKPVTLRAKVDYAVCEKLCVPVEAQMQLTLAGKGGDGNPQLAAAEAQVPKPVSAAEAGLTARRVTGDKRKPLVFVDLAARPGQPIQLFVEGPTPEWALPIPQAAPDAAPGHQHFSFELDGLPPGVDPMGPFELTFTIVKGTKATEVRTHLD